jgi:two-component SAPR family response regulator
MSTLSKSNIKEFLNQYCDEVYDMPDHALELLMDDHKCIVWYGKEYFIPENNSFWTEDENEIAKHLMNNFLY